MPNPQSAPSSFVPPYPPSWLDHFTAWVDRLPGPAWVFYLVLGILAALVEAAIQWQEGAYPFGTFDAALVFTAVIFVYLLGLMHYLDKAAASALEAFRPLLPPASLDGRLRTEDQSLYRRLSYELTTLPARPALAATLLGVAFALGDFTLRIATGDDPPYLAGTARTALSTATFMPPFVAANGIMVLLLYHTLHQLAQVSRVYTKYAAISIYRLKPLYALSLPGAYTAGGIIVFISTFLATTTQSLQTAGLVALAISLTFAAIAGATFALPLAGAHRRLVKEKDSRLMDISSRFEVTSARLHHQLDGNRLLQMDALNKALASLEIEHAFVRRVPTWPWEPGTLRGLLAALLLPIAVWLIQLLLGRVFGALP